MRFYQGRILNEEHYLEIIGGSYREDEAARRKLLRNIPIIIFFTAITWCCAFVLVKGICMLL